jgi:hypothetical protein
MLNDHLIPGQFPDKMHPHFDGKCAGICGRSPNSTRNTALGSVSTSVRLCSRSHATIFSPAAPSSILNIAQYFFAPFLQRSVTDFAAYFWLKFSNENQFLFDFLQ